MSSEHFRKLLQQFYIKINTSEHADVYKKMLSEQFDEVEVQPIHIITLTQEPTYKNAPSAKKQVKKAECLYKSTDFAAVFLFGFVMKVLKNGDREFLKGLQARVMDNLDVFYGDKDTEDSKKYKFLFEGMFDFCEMVLEKKYENSQLQKVFRSFYANTFQRRGLKKTDRQKFLTESQIVLSFLLGKGGNFPSKKQVSEPTSDVYQLNSLQFCINIQNVDENQQWTIGEGENHINIAKEKNQYYIYEDMVESSQVPEEEISQIWQGILRESLQIRKSQHQKTAKIFIQLNMVEIGSPAKSMRSPKSVQVKYGVKKTKIGDFF